VFVGWSVHTCHWLKTKRKIYGVWICNIRQVYAMPIFESIETILVTRFRLPQGLLLRLVARSAYVGMNWRQRDWNLQFFACQLDLTIDIMSAIACSIHTVHRGNFPVLRRPPRLLRRVRVHADLLLRKQQPASMLTRPNNSLDLPVTKLVWILFAAPLHSVAEDQEAAEVQRVVVCQLGKRHQFFVAFFFQIGRVQSWDWPLPAHTCFVRVCLPGLHRRRSAADACVYHRRLTEHRPRRVDVPVLLLNPDACMCVTWLPFLTSLGVRLQSAEMQRTIQQTVLATAVCDVFYGFWYKTARTQ